MEAVGSTLILPMRLYFTSVAALFVATLIEFSINSKRAPRSYGKSLPHTMSLLDAQARAGVWIAVRIGRALSLARAQT